MKKYYVPFLIFYQIVFYQIQGKDMPFSNKSSKCVYTKNTKISCRLIPCSKLLFVFYMDLSFSPLGIRNPFQEGLHSEEYQPVHQLQDQTG